jgi:hypothetical protein
MPNDLFSDGFYGGSCDPKLMTKRTRLITFAVLYWSGPWYSNLAIGWQQPRRVCLNLENSTS